MIMERFKNILFFIILIAMITILFPAFIFFTVWEKVNKRESDLFWQNVYDPYQ